MYIHYHHVAYLKSIYFCTLKGRFAFELSKSAGFKLESISHIIDEDRLLNFTSTGKWGVFAEFDSGAAIKNVHIFIPSVSNIFFLHKGMQCGSKDVLRYAIIIEKLMSIFRLLHVGTVNDENLIFSKSMLGDRQVRLFVKFKLGLVWFGFVLG